MTTLTSHAHTQSRSPTPTNYAHTNYILCRLLLISFLFWQTSFSHFPSACMEVLRSQGDFQWLYSALQGACPERIVPPLRPPISLDATISEFQRFLSRLSAHKLLSTHHFFIVFLSGTAEVGGDTFILPSQQNIKMGFFYFFRNCGH